MAVAKRPSHPECTAQCMFCIWSQRRAVAAEAGLLNGVDVTSAANLTGERSDAPHPQEADRQGLFSKECRHVLVHEVVTWGPNASAALSVRPGTEGGSKDLPPCIVKALSTIRVVSFAADRIDTIRKSRHRLNRDVHYRKAFVSMFAAQKVGVQDY